MSSGDAEMGCRAAGVVPPGVATLGALPERRRKERPDGVRVRLPPGPQLAPRAANIYSAGALTSSRLRVSAVLALEPAKLDPA